MKENLLQFIWQFQHFNKQNLKTTQGEKVEIIHQGNYNSNQGPDFLLATVIINNIKLVGNVELHVLSSHWQKHKHNQSKHYDNVILHVVWQHDTEILLNNNYLPTIELQTLVAKVLLSKYETLMQQDIQLPCCNFLPALNSIGWVFWTERLATERLIEKAQKILTHFEANKSSWEETFWQTLAYNFGLKQNTDLFMQMAKNISVQILAKHKNQIQQLEALLMGNANMLNENSSNKYEMMLLKEYAFFQKKYNIKSVSIQPSFLRMRPYNFPTIRLAQLASLTHQSSHLFSKIISLKTTYEIFKLFKVTASDFWHYHYTFDNTNNKKEPKELGKSTINTLIINCIIPTVFAKGLYDNNDLLKTKAIEWLQELQPEKNTITLLWKNYNIQNKNALQSQALIQLYNNYCKSKKCLQCAVGNKILKS